MENFGSAATPRTARRRAACCSRTNRSSSTSSALRFSSPRSTRSSTTPSSRWVLRGCALCEDQTVGAEITTLTDRQVPEAAATLARAFHDDPLMVYAIPDAAERARLLPEVYARMVRFGLLAGEVLA